MMLLPQYYEEAADKVPYEYTVIYVCYYISDVNNLCTLFEKVRGFNDHGQRVTQDAPEVSEGVSKVVPGVLREFLFIKGIPCSRNSQQSLTRIIEKNPASPRTLSLSLRSFQVSKEVTGVIKTFHRSRSHLGVLGLIEEVPVILGSAPLFHRQRML